MFRHRSLWEKFHTQTDVLCAKSMKKMRTWGREKGNPAGKEMRAGSW